MLSEEISRIEEMTSILEKIAKIVSKGKLILEEMSKYHEKNIDKMTDNDSEIVIVSLNLWLDLIDKVKNLTDLEKNKKHNIEECQKVYIESVIAITQLEKTLDFVKKFDQ